MTQLPRPRTASAQTPGICFDPRTALPMTTPESAEKIRANLIAAGILTAYVEDQSDYDHTRPTMFSGAVQSLRERLIRSGNLVVGEATRSYVGEKDGRRYYYEADLSLPTPIQLDDDQE